MKHQSSYLLPVTERLLDCPTYLICSATLARRLTQH